MVRHLAPVGEGEEAVVVVDRGAEFGDVGGAAAGVGNGVLACDAGEEGLEGCLCVASTFDVVVAVLNLEETRTDGEVGGDVAWAGVEVFDAEEHVVVAHFAYQT